MQTLESRWDEIWANLDEGLQSPEHLRGVLEDARGISTLKGLGIEEWELRQAFHRARDIRGRYTILDLTWEMGHLADLEAQVLQTSGVLG